MSDIEVEMIACRVVDLLLAKLRGALQEPKPIKWEEGGKELLLAWVNSLQRGVVTRNKVREASK